MIRLVVLDMAGTTVRDDGQVPAAFTAALSEHHIVVTDEQIANVRGASKRQAVRAFAPDNADVVYESFKRNLTERYLKDGVQPIDGARQVFEKLRSRGIKVALNTGFDRDIAYLLIQALKWDAGVVDAVVCGDEVKNGRPAPDLIFRAMELTRTTSPERVATVGDTTLDLEAGTAAQVRMNIAVLSGAHDRARLEAAPHTHIIQSVKDLPRLLLHDQG